jgi:small subunit ribosomal protein S4e
MTNHQKRLSVPNSWPVERKTETFTVKAGAGPHGEAGVPLLIVLRDVLGYADTRKEARYALDQDSVLINGTPVSDEERPVGMFDILAFAEREEYYRVFPGEGGRLSLTAIDADAAGSKLGKVVEKRHVPGGDVQLTLHDGRTLVVDDTDYDGGDSVVVSNDDSEVVAHFEYEEGALVTAVDGEHAGEVGTVDAIQVTPGSADNIVRVTQDGDAGFETVEDYVVVIDENFTDDDAAADTDVEDEPDETDVDADESEADDEDDADESDAEDDADESEADDAEDGESEADADESEADDEDDADESEEEADADADDSEADADDADESEADADDAEASEADADDGGDEQ